MHLYDSLMANYDLASHGFGLSRSLNETQIGSTFWNCCVCPTDRLTSMCNFVATYAGH